jgi:Domain of Unknown Function (DUF1543)
MYNLYAFYLGGRGINSNIEVHDIVFSIGQNIEECYPDIHNKWFGSKDHVHIDSYCKLNSLQDYRIYLLPKNKTHKESIQDNELKVFMINFGWSENNFFGEKHIAKFIVAKSSGEAIKKINQTIDKENKIDFHCDNKISIDDCICVSDFIKNYTINIVEDKNSLNPEIINCYKKICP